MIEESKCCSDVMKKHFNKEFVMTKEDNEDFEFYQISDLWQRFFDNGVKVRDHCYIIATYRDSLHRDCNINLKLNQKFPVVFHNLKNYDPYLILQELGKFNIKILWIRLS